MKLSADSPMENASPTPAVGIALRILVEVALALQLVAAAFYWWLSPKGFPVDHSRFWINSVLPVAVMAVATVGLVGMLQHRRRLAAVAVLCFSSGWAAAAVAGRGFFPSSFCRIWLFGLLVADCRRRLFCATATVCPKADLPLDLMFDSFGLRCRRRRVVAASPAPNDSAHR